MKLILENWKLFKLNEKIEMYYQAIGLKPTDDMKAIKAAYRKAAISTHPDRGGDEEEFKKVSNAKDILLNTSEKQKYDKELYNMAAICKKEEPNNKFCTKNGYPIDDASMQRLARIAGVGEAQPQSSSPQAAQDNYSAKIDFLKKKNELIQTLFGIVMNKYSEGNIKYAENFKKILKTVQDAQDMESIKDIYDHFGSKQ